MIQKHHGAFAFKLKLVFIRAYAISAGEDHGNPSL
jgi:hypothetical protein